MSFAMLSSSAQVSSSASLIQHVTVNAIPSCKVLPNVTLHRARKLILASEFCSARTRPLIFPQRKGRKAAGRGGALGATCTSQSIGEKFAELKAKNEVALIPFIVAGDPNLETTERALLALADAGADIIELGVPYSDPLADGPVIQAAAGRALHNGTDLQGVLDLLAKVSPSLSSPVVLFTYYNPIMKRGAERFMKDAKAAGAAGLVVPDVPLEETGPLRELTSANGLDLVLLTTPTTPSARMSAIAEATQGFMYLVSLTGVTGERSQVQGRVEGLLKDIKQTTEKPVAVGFGISSPAHAKQVIEWGADGVIIGSSLVRLLGEVSDPEDGLRKVVSLMKSLKDECKKPLPVS